MKTFPLAYFRIPSLHLALVVECLWCFSLRTYILNPCFEHEVLRKERVANTRGLNEFIERRENASMDDHKQQSSYVIHFQSFVVFERVTADWRCLGPQSILPPRWTVHLRGHAKVSGAWTRPWWRLTVSPRSTWEGGWRSPRGRSCAGGGSLSPPSSGHPGPPPARGTRGAERVGVASSPRRRHTCTWPNGNWRHVSMTSQECERANVACGLLYVQVDEMSQFQVLGGVF